MKSFFQDEYINKKLLERMVKQVQEEQLDKTIDEIGYLNEIQSHVLSRCDFTPSQNEELEFIKKLNNARKNTKIQA